MYTIMTPMDAPTILAFDADDYGDVLRFFYFVI